MSVASSEVRAHVVSVSEGTSRPRGPARGPSGLWRVAVLSVRLLQGT